MVLEETNRELLVIFGANVFDLLYETLKTTSRNVEQEMDQVAGLVTIGASRWLMFCRMTEFCYDKPSL